MYSTYETGFGTLSLDKEFFLGLKYINLLTTTNEMRLRINLK